MFLRHFPFAYVIIIECYLVRGQFGIALLYAILSVSLGVTGLIFGLTVMRLVG